MPLTNALSVVMPHDYYGSAIGNRPATETERAEKH